MSEDAHDYEFAGDAGEKVERHDCLVAECEPVGTFTMRCKTCGRQWHFPVKIVNKVKVNR